MNSTSSSRLCERLAAIQKSLTHRTNRSRSSSSESEHEIQTKKIKIVKRNDRKSLKQDPLIDTSRCCAVSLESTYRENLKSNTTYLIGKTHEGQMILLPKDLIEQANIMTIDENQVVSLSDEEQLEPSRKQGEFQSSKSAYTSQGNVVTCITGSFN